MGRFLLTLVLLEWRLAPRVKKYNPPRWLFGSTRMRNPFANAVLILALLTGTSLAGGRARTHHADHASVRTARLYSRPAVIAQRNAGGRPWAWGFYYSGRAAFNLSGIPGQVIGGVIGGLFP